MTLSYEQEIETDSMSPSGRIVSKHTLPTGYLFVGEYSKGKLETLSIGDYGKKFNVKADFLGLRQEINGVPNVPCMPLQEKWVITISTQYGCPMKCTFCDVPNIKFQGNAYFVDLWAQIENAIRMFPGVHYTERLNIHFARMGEPILNPNVFEFAEWLAKSKDQIRAMTGLRVEVVHPVLTTSLPKAFKHLEERILRWCGIKNNYFNGQAGLQFSINSTSDEQRSAMYRDMQLSLADLSRIADKMPIPISRKYCLNFAWASDFEVDGRRLANLFDPQKFMCKITPIHNNNACRDAGHITLGGYDSYPYKKPEDALKEYGFDVLVFVPSLDEEHGLVTCGNAILGGSVLPDKLGALSIEGQPQETES